jgi:hypothetical protein
MFGQIKLLLFLASCPPLIRAVEEHERIAFDSRVNGESGRHMIGWLSRKPLLPVRCYGAGGEEWHHRRCNLMMEWPHASAER